MCVPTEIRDSAKAMDEAPNHGTKVFNLPQVFTCKKGNLFYVNPGERGKKSGTRKPAKDLNTNHFLACLPLHDLPVQLLPLAAAIEFKKDKVILYSRN